MGQSNLKDLDDTFFTSLTAVGVICAKETMNHAHVNIIHGQGLCQEGFFRPFAQKLKDQKTQSQGISPNNSRIFRLKTQDIGNKGKNRKIWPQIAKF